MNSPEFAAARAPAVPDAAPAPGGARFRPADLFDLPEGSAYRQVVDASDFQRLAWELPQRAEVCLDRFPASDAACAFLRLAPGAARSVRFALDGAYRVSACAAGGWLLDPAQPALPGYWLPRPPVSRRLDADGHILAETPAAVSGIALAADGLAVELELAADMHLDWVLWRLPATLLAELEQTVSLERQPRFLWGSKTVVQSPADLYLHLVHGQVYANDFVYPRRWKFASEHDAHGLFVALDGLELATGKQLYRMLKRQTVHSVIAWQATDGNWRDGEWTDLMESHYRSHNGAMLMLATALEEEPDDTVRQALARAVAYAIAHADKTDLGLWFLHDSLEESAAAMDEMLRQTGTRWIPSRALGKSPCNKFILNTHLDAVVAVDRYRAVTGDDRYARELASARATTRAVLALRPAEPLYRAVYRAVGLTLLPKAQAERLPWLLRVVKRLASMILIPRLHRIKQRFPRMVMPGGLIERHLSSLHFGTHYHAVNLMDLARYRRRFPEDDIGRVIDDAVAAGARLLDHWAESKNRRFAIVVWADALYHLCTLDPAPEYRRLLADALLRIADLGLGLPPSLLGGDAEAVRPEHRVACPAPLDHRLRVANLSCGGRREFLVVNPAREALALAWQLPPQGTLTWTVEGAQQPAAAQDVPARGWLWARED
jgi:hypothetical protein